MNPISRLRTRARSAAGRSATGRLFSRYCPLLGESRSPKMERRVDLPQPDGPLMDTYSPFSISMCTPASACVSTSSVRNTFVTLSSFKSGSMLVLDLLRRGRYFCLLYTSDAADDLL